MPKKRTAAELKKLMVRKPTKSDLILKQLADIPVIWDVTGKRRVPKVMTYEPDLIKIGRLIVKARFHLARIGVRKRKL